MKNFLTFTFAMFMSIVSFAQSPQAVCYQAVATDAAGIELQARNISIRSTLLQGTIDGAVVTQEIYQVVTDDFGLFNLEIGQGAPVSGAPDFENINWAQGPFFLRMEMDPNGGTDFISLGTSQILSVPYAIYSDKSNSSQNAINAQNAVNAEIAVYADTATVALTAVNDNDTSPSNEIQFLQYDATAGVLNLTGSNEPGVDITSFDLDSNPENELQDLAYDAASGELSLSNAPGTAVTINTNDADADPINEIQNLEYNTTTAILSLTNTTDPGVLINTDDADANPANELQDLEYDAATGELSLTNAPGAAITINTNDADANPANELQDLEYDAATGELSLSNAPGAAVTINTNDADANPENELQNLQYNSTTGGLSLTGVTASETVINIDDADADPTNEMQQLSFEGNVLTISGDENNGIDFGAELFGAPGASSDFPQGIIGQHLVLKTGTFTVPAGKTFYLTASGNNVDFLTPSNVVVTHPTTPNMPIFGPGTEITDCKCTGMLVNFNENIAPAVLDLTATNAVYTVPPGFILFLKSGISNSMTGMLKIDGDNMEFLRPNFTRGSRIISFPEGTNIQRPTNSDPGAFVLTGYLIAIPN